MSDIETLRANPSASPSFSAHFLTILIFLRLFDVIFALLELPVLDASPSSSFNKANRLLTL